MTARERKLAAGVGAVLLVLINLFLVSFFVKNQRRLRAELAGKSSDLAAMQAIFSEKELWEKRDAWLQGKHPKLTNEGGAGVQLLDQVKEAAQKNTVLLENPAIGTAQNRKQYIAVSVNVETKSSWQGLCTFVRDLQGIEQFVVFESANFQVDPADKTQMRGRLKIGKWYAPK